VHFPELAAEMVTDVAVIVPFLDFPVTVRHSPTVTEDKAVATV
jgi:hypothetical protein